jgi:hypothetical protein
VWFAYFKSEKKAKVALKTLKKEKIECYFVKPCKKGIEVD